MQPELSSPMNFSTFLPLFVMNVQHLWRLSNSHIHLDLIARLFFFYGVQKHYAEQIAHDMTVTSSTLITDRISFYISHKSFLCSSQSILYPVANTSSYIIKQSKLGILWLFLLVRWCPSQIHYQKSIKPFMSNAECFQVENEEKHVCFLAFWFNITSGRVSFTSSLDKV